MIHLNEKIRYWYMFLINTPTCATNRIVYNNFIKSLCTQKSCSLAEQKTYHRCNCCAIINNNNNSLLRM